MRIKCYLSSPWKKDKSLSWNVAKYFKTLAFQYKKIALLGNYFWRINVGQISVSSNELLMLRDDTRTNTNLPLSLSHPCAAHREHPGCERVWGERVKFWLWQMLGADQKCPRFLLFPVLYSVKRTKERDDQKGGNILLRDLVTSAVIPLFTELLCSAAPSSLYQWFSKWGPHTNTSSILRTCQKCTFLGPRLRFTESEALGLGSRAHTEVWEPLLSNPVVRRAKVP